MDSYQQQTIPKPPSSQLGQQTSNSNTKYKMSVIVGAIIACVGYIILMLILYVLFEFKQGYIQKGIKTTATVTSVKTSQFDLSRTESIVYIQYITQDGKKIVGWNTSTQNNADPPKYKAGQQVTVYYDRKDPTNYLIYDPASTNTELYLGIFFTIGFFSIIIFIIIYYFYQKKKHSKFLSSHSTVHSVQSNMVPTPPPGENPSQNLTKFTPWSRISVAVVAGLTGFPGSYLIVWQELKRLGKYEEANKFLLFGGVILLLFTLGLVFIPFINFIAGFPSIVVLLALVFPVWLNSKYLNRWQKDHPNQAKFSMSLIGWGVLGLITYIMLILVLT